MWNTFLKVIPWKCDGKLCGSEIAHNYRINTEWIVKRLVPILYHPEWTNYFVSAMWGWICLRQSILQGNVACINSIWRRLSEKMWLIFFMWFQPSNIFSTNSALSRESFVLQKLIKIAFWALTTCQSLF